MGIDDIKPPGFYGSFAPSSAESPIESKRDNSFAEVKGKAEPPAAESARLSLVAAADLKKADLQDPAKLEEIVRNSASELIDSQSLSGPLSAADKKSLVDFLSQDPMFRQQMESYLRKVAV